jgi:hypothetical protein
MRLDIFRVFALLLAGGLVLAVPSAVWSQAPLHQPTGCPSSGTPLPTCITTYMYENQRLGLNQNESALTKSAITGSGMQIAFTEGSSRIDDQIYGQPLYLPSVAIGTTPYPNVVYVATESNTVYAFDADSGGAALWHDNLTPPLSAPVNESIDTGCTNINPTYGTMSPTSSGNVGITGTPVIDISANTSHTSITIGTLYVVAASVSPASCATVWSTGCTFTQTLYALDVVAGTVKAHTTINPSATTYTSGGSSSTLYFSTYDARHANQRGALLLQADSDGNNIVYIPFSSHCDNDPWAGWLVGYSLSNSPYTLTQESSWLVDPQEDTSGHNDGSIWGAGNGPAGDGTAIYTVTGNGPYDITPDTEISSGSCTYDTSLYNACNYSDSIIKLDSGLTPKDFFSPADAASRQANDWDMGSGGVMVVPDQPSGSNPTGMLIQGGKEGNLYLVNRSTGYMGGFTTGSGGIDNIPWEVLGNATLNDPDSGDTVDLSKGLCFAYTDTNTDECGMWSSAAWWNAGHAQGSSSPYTSYVYVAPEGNTFNDGNQGEIIQYTLCPGATGLGSICSAYTTSAGLVLASTPVVSTDDPLEYPGLTPVITTASETSTSAVLWALDNSAFANSSSSNNAILFGYDATTLGTAFFNSSTSSINPGAAVKFTIPTVANGKIYVGGNQQLTVYELVP